MLQTKPVIFLKIASASRGTVFASLTAAKVIAIPLLWLFSVIKSHIQNRLKPTLSAH
jgi:hypothetical protein